jgi:hypothetical protein
MRIPRIFFIANCLLLTGHFLQAQPSVTIGSGNELFFTDYGTIRSYDNNHRIMFRRTENIMEFREFGSIMFSPGAESGTQTGKMFMGSNGNMGIGTTSPQALFSLGGGTGGKKLLVYDGGTTAGVQAGFGVDMSTSARELSIFHSTSDGANGDISFGKRLENSGAYTEAMRITGTGKVGIGTVNTNDAGYKLFVETGIRTRKVKVDQSTWADYVFQTNYRLRPLSEVEQYIKQYHHLPEVPSADEVAKEGLNLGDNQAMLLKKIEELTLYVIEQNKKMQALEAEVKSMKGKRK